MSMNAQASLEVLLYCLGSAAYRHGRERQFLDAVAGLPGTSLTKLVGGAHLAGLFASLGAPLAGDSRALAAALSELAPILEARLLFNHNILAELLNLGALIAETDPGARPVVMKGMSYWGVYYDEAMARRVRDIDLFIEGPDHADALFDILEREGYEGLLFVDDERTAREHFRHGSGYSVPPYRIRRRADLGDADPGRVRALVERHGAETGFELMDDGGPVVTIDIEVHRALFLSLSGDLAATLPQDFRSAAALPPYRELTPAVALAYTAVKLSHDILETVASDAPSLKCLKLAADFVRIFEQSGRDDIAGAVAVARRWNCLHHLLDTLQAIQPLVPGIVLRDLPPPQEPPLLDVLLRTALGSDAETGSC